MTTLLNEPVVHNDEGDYVRCPCGNTPMGSGFYTATEAGEFVSPMIGSGWDGDHIACGECGRVISQSSWLVTAQAAPGAAERWAAQS